MTLPLLDPPHRGVHVYAEYRNEPLRLSCEVVVVGSGPGGAVVAKELADLGHDVILLEEGPPIAVREMTTEASSSLRKIFRDAGMRVTRGNSFIPTMQAIALGGGSLVNSAICCRAPGWSLDAWAEEHGLPGLAAGSLDADYDALEAFLGVEPTSRDVQGERNLLFQRGCDALGISSEPTPRNVKGCRGSSECFTGCRNRAKQSTDISFVPAAVEKGARVYTSVRVEQVLAEGKRATGVRGVQVAPFTGKRGAEVVVTAQKVVLAAGCMATPCILLKSGLGNESGQVGQHLLGHPGLAVYGIFDHPVRPWTGATQGYHSMQFLREKMKLEVLWGPPAALAVRFPGLGDEFKDHLLSFERMAPFDVFIAADRSSGSVRPLPFSTDPDIRFELDQRDVELLRRGACLLTDICWAAGAESVLPGIHRAPAVMHRKDGTDALRKLDVRATDYTMTMNHVFGTTRMGGNPRTSVVDENGRCHTTRNLYVADTSVFPGSTAVNPMLTMMALARRTARAVAAEGAGR